MKMIIDFFLFFFRGKNEKFFSVFLEFFGNDSGYKMIKFWSATRIWSKRFFETYANCALSAVALISVVFHSLLLPSWTALPTHPWDP